MSITLQPGHAYAFLFGLFIGKFTNLFSDVVIAGLVLYTVTPEIYTEERVKRAKNYFYSWFGSKQPIMIELDNLTEDQKEQLKKLTSSSLTDSLPVSEQSKSIFDFSNLPKIELLSRK